MTEEEQNKIEKDILFQIDNLGTIYAYKDIMDLEEAEKDKEIKLLREAVKKLQADIDLKDKVIDNLYSDIEYEYQGTHYLKSLEEYYEEVEKVGGEDE